MFLGAPLKGRLGTIPVVVMDLGLEGAGIEHSGAVVVGERLRLEIDAKHPIRMRARVCHSQLKQLASVGSPASYHTGVAFVTVSEDQATLIDNVLIDEARAKIAEWEANLTGTRRRTLPTLTPLPDSPHAYAWHRLVKGDWTRSITRDPNQPIDGFAVCDDEAAEKILMLRKAYELYDDDDRYMLRMMAQLVISERDRRH